MDKAKGDVRVTVTNRNIETCAGKTVTRHVPTFERVENNADLVKWCVHTLGSDDLVPVRSHGEAVAWANAQNDFVLSAVGVETDVLCYSYPLPWPHGDEAHAEALADTLENNCLWARERNQPLSFEMLREANIARQLEWPGNEKCDLAFRAIEFSEEAGEVAGAIKKYLRGQRGIAGSKMTIGDIADEMGDVLVSLDLVAGMLGINLAKAAANKFNATSEKVGLQTRLPEASDGC